MANVIKKHNIHCQQNVTQMATDVLFFNQFIGCEDVVESFDGTSITGTVRKLYDETIHGIRIKYEDYIKLTDEQKAGTYYVTDLSRYEYDIPQMFNTFVASISDIDAIVGDNNVSNLSITDTLSALKYSINNHIGSVFYSEPESDPNIEFNFQKFDATIFGNESSSYYATTNDISAINTRINNVTKMLNSIHSSMIYDTYDQMITWLKNKSNANKLISGSMLLIKEIGVPDYVIINSMSTVNSEGLYYDIESIETNKTDLSDYDNIIGYNDISGIYDGTITGAIAYLDGLITDLTDICK